MRKELSDKRANEQEKEKKWSRKRVFLFFVFNAISRMSKKMQETVKEHEEVGKEDVTVRRRTRILRRALPLSLLRLLQARSPEHSSSSSSFCFSFSLSLCLCSTIIAVDLVSYLFQVSSPSFLSLSCVFPYFPLSLLPVIQARSLGHSSSSSSFFCTWANWQLKHHCSRPCELSLSSFGAWQL